MYRPTQQPMSQRNNAGYPQPRPEWLANHRNDSNSRYSSDERLMMQQNALANAYKPKRSGFFGAIEDMLDPQLPVVEIIQIDALDQLLLVPWAQWKDLPSSNSLPIPPSQSNANWLANDPMQSDANWLSNDPMQSDANWLSNDPMQSKENQDPTLGTFFLCRKKFNLGMILSFAYGAMFLFIFAITISAGTQSFSSLAMFIPLFLICLAVFGASFYYSRKKIWIDVSKEYLIIDCSLHHNGKRKFFLRNPRDTQAIIEISKSSKSRSYNVYLANGKQKTCVGSWLKMNNAVLLKSMMDTLLMAQL